MTQLNDKSDFKDFKFTNFKGVEVQFKEEFSK